MFSSNWQKLQVKITETNKNKKSYISSNNPDNDSPNPEIWFDVDEASMVRSEIEKKILTQGNSKVNLIDLFPSPKKNKANDSEINNNSINSDGHVDNKYLAIDCEMVGVGHDGTNSALARVSIVNYHGQVVLDQYCRPTERITDFRTEVSGIEPRHVINAPTLASVQETVWKILKGKILIGHSLHNDFKALLLEHPKKMTRDTSKYRPFRRISRGKSPSLKRLAKHFLGATIQEGSHCSVDDARATMLLYRAHKTEWENYLFRNEGKKFKQQKKSKKGK